MIIPDINLLLYAEIDASAFHERAKEWWEGLLSERHPIGLPSVVLFGFLRVATNRRTFREPLAIGDALARVGAWLDRPHVSVLVPGRDYLGIAFGLLREAGTAANLTTDVQIAAHALELQAEVHSNDGDFSRFAGLRHVNPLRI